MSLVPVQRQLSMQLCESSADDPKAPLKGELGPTNSAKARRTKASELHSPDQKVFFKALIILRWREGIPC